MTPWIADDNKDNHVPQMPPTASNSKNIPPAYSNNDNIERPSPPAAPIPMSQPPKLPTALPTTLPIPTSIEAPTITDVLSVAAPSTAPIATVTATTTTTTAGSNIVLEPEETTTTTTVFKHWIVYSILGSLVLTAVISTWLIRRRIHEKRLCWIKNNSGCYGCNGNDIDDEEDDDITIIFDEVEDEKKEAEDGDDTNKRSDDEMNILSTFFEWTLDNMILDVRNVEKEERDHSDRLDNQRQFRRQMSF
jgi:hypothetical protein